MGLQDSNNKLYFCPSHKSTYRYVRNPFFMIFNCSWVCEKLVSFFPNHLEIVMTQNNLFQILGRINQHNLQLMITLYCLIFFSFLVTSTYRYVGNPFFMIFNCSWVCEKLLFFVAVFKIVMTQNNYFKFLAELTNIIFQ